jgi:RNA polymerase sigma-70 factor (ECF subfamily)
VGVGESAEGRPLDGLDELELIARAKGGDHAAYGDLVRRYQEIAFRTAYLILLDADEAEDAAQTAFIKAYYALGRFEADPAKRDRPGRGRPAPERAATTDHEATPFRPWLLRIVANEARNRRVAAARRTKLALRAGAAAAGPGPGPGSSGSTPHGVLGHSGDAAPSPEAAALAAEQRAELLAAVGGLREEDRAVIACRYFLDLSEAETAETLGLPRGTVKSRLSRALGRVRALLTTPAETGGRAARG